MGNEKTKQFGKWLTRKFLDLQSESDRAWTVTEFAEYLECTQPSVSRWMAGKSLPDEARVVKLADKLGDEIFDLADLPRPEPLRRRLMTILDSLDDDGKQKLMVYAEKLYKQNQQGRGQK